MKAVPLTRMSRAPGLAASRSMGIRLAGVFVRFACISVFSFPGGHAVRCQAFSMPANEFNQAVVTPSCERRRASARYSIRYAALLLGPGLADISLLIS